MSRRNFLKQSLLFLLAIGSGSWLTCCKKARKIDRIEVFKVNVEKTSHFSWGKWQNRQHVFLKFTLDDAVSWGEMLASKNNPDLDLIEWGDFLKDLKGFALEEIQEFLTAMRGIDRWHKAKLETVELAIWDLLAQQQKIPAVSLLGLKKKNAIPGLYCVLEYDPAKVKDRIQQGLGQNYKTHFKLKIFGELEHDIKLIRAARSVIASDAVLIADANRGYKSYKNLNELARFINRLADNGLNALEDPAQLSIEEFVELNRLVRLSLIPDFILRPSWEAVNKIVPNMGDIYNIHPATMGDIRDVIAMIGKIISWEAGLMIGDNSYIGPACTIWQQIAIGAGAVWVEAIEKPHESDIFIECLTEKATYRDNKGQFAMHEMPGFGIKVDEILLKRQVHGYCQIL